MTEEYHMRLVTLGGASVGKSAIIKVILMIFSFVFIHVKSIRMLIK